MSVRYVFANESGNQPASQLDQMFGDVWNGATLSCTVTGTNALVLTPRADVNLPTSYVPNVRIGFTAGANSTGSVTAQLGTLTALNVYQPGGTQAGSGNILANTYYEIAYDANLNTGAGGFWMVSATASTPSIAQPIQSTHKNVQLLVASNTTLTPTADAVIVQNSTGGTFRITSYAPPNTATSTTGANGLDTGSVADNTIYYFFAIYNSTTSTAAGLLSLSATAPTLPSGYTYSARLGAVLTNASAQLYVSKQLGDDLQFIVGTNPTVPIVVTQGIVGTYSATNPILQGVSLSGLVPTTARRAKLLWSNDYKNGTSGNILIAPNINYGGTGFGPSGTNGNVYPVWTTAAGSGIYEPVLESLTIGAAMSTTAGIITLMGWTDNIT